MRYPAERCREEVRAIHLIANELATWTRRRSLNKCWNLFSANEKNARQRSITGHDTLIGGRTPISAVE